MSTRSLIAIKNADGSIDAIYCHSDGYLWHNGAILQRHYKDEGKVRALISLGAISILGKQVEQDQYTKKYNGFFSPEFNQLSIKEQMQITEASDATIAYHRDRGDDWEDCQIEHYASSADLDQALKDDYFIEYLYLFKQSAKTHQWSWYVMGWSGETEEYPVADDNYGASINVRLTPGSWRSLNAIEKRAQEALA